MKKRRSNKLALNKLTVRPLDNLTAAQGGYNYVSLGNTQCSRTHDNNTNPDLVNCNVHTL